MRYAIISDIHANLQAWNAVLIDIRSMNVDEILCLGDVVGYGPQPAAVLEQAYANVHHFVLGNHDAVLCGKMNPECFNEMAREIIAWTGGQISSKGKKFLAGLPYVLDAELFCCAHADPSAPAAYGYILEPEAALQVWNELPHQLIFVGHSHVPGLYVVGNSGRAHWLAPTDYALEAGKRYIVNVGSVGQPRNGDVRACYCLFDTESEAVRFRQVPFDLQAYREDLAAAGLPEKASYFLSTAVEAEPLREMLDFHPPSAAEVRKQPVTVKKLEEAVRSARRWKFGAALLLMLLFLALVTTGVVLRSLPAGPVRYDALDVETVAIPALGGECLQPPEAIGQLDAENCLRQWTVEVADPELQQVHTELRPDLLPQDAADLVLFRVCSDEPLPFFLSSLPVPVRPGMRFAATASFKKLQLQDGHIEICLVQDLPNQVEKLLAHRVIDRLADTDNWLHASITMPRAERGVDRAGHVRVLVRGQFSGEVLIRNISMIHKEYHSRIQ